MDDLGKVRFVNTTLGIVISPSCLLQKTISHTEHCNINFLGIFPVGWGIDLFFFFFFCITANPHTVNSEREKNELALSAQRICITLIMIVILSANYQYKVINCLICIPALKRFFFVRSCSYGVIVAGFINKTYSALSFFFQRSPKAVIIFNDRGAVLSQETWSQSHVTGGELRQRRINVLPGKRP